MPQSLLTNTLAHPACSSRATSVCRQCLCIVSMARLIVGVLAPKQHYHKLTLVQQDTHAALHYRQAEVHLQHPWGSLKKRSLGYTLSFLKSMLQESLPITEARACSHFLPQSGALSAHTVPMIHHSSRGGVTKKHAWLVLVLQT